MWVCIKINNKVFLFLVFAESLCSFTLSPTVVPLGRHLHVALQSCPPNPNTKLVIADSDAHLKSMLEFLSYDNWFFFVLDLTDAGSLSFLFYSVIWILTLFFVSWRELGSRENSNDELWYCQCCNWWYVSLPNLFCENFVFWKFTGDPATCYYGFVCNQFSSLFTLVCNLEAGLQILLTQVLMFQMTMLLIVLADHTHQS